MSSETSTDRQSFQPWQFFVLAGLVAATALVYLQVFVWGAERAAAILLSLTAGAAALAGLAAYRTFLPLAGSTDFRGPEVLGGRTRAALEREKGLVLRSIKELEFDKAMGKVSARLRVRATGLMRQLDRGASYREEIEKELARRLGQTAPDAPPATVRPVAPACPACRIANDMDAKFCKGCGTPMEVA
jgi:hypothetical protein